MNSQTLGSLDPIYINSFLSAFKSACDTNGVHGGAALRLLHFFMKRPAAGALNAHIPACSKSHRRQQEGTVTPYCEAVKYILKTNGTDDAFAPNLTLIRCVLLNGRLNCLHNMQKRC